jgi:hypothetical protein
VGKDKVSSIATIRCDQPLRIGADEFELLCFGGKKNQQERKKRKRNEEERAMKREGTREKRKIKLKEENLQ